MRISEIYSLIELNNYNKNFTEIFNSVCEFLADGILKKYRNSLNFFLFLYDKNREHLHLAYHYNEDICELDENILKKQTEEITSIQQNKFYVAIKLHIKDRQYGFYVIESSRTIPLKIKLLQTFHTAAYYLIHEFYSMKIFHLVIKDELTGLYNKRYLISYLYQNFKNYKKSGSPFCLAILDIDKFKHYNDTYGHLIGDYLLRKIAKIILRFSASHNITAFRYGGEEIVLVFPDKARGETLFLMEKLRKEIQAFDFSNNDYFLKLTISAGISELSQAESVSLLLSKADSALYDSKENGRNRVTFFEQKKI